VTGRRRRRGGGGLPAQRGGKRRRGSGDADGAGSGVAVAASEAAAASGAAAAESGSPAPARRQSRQGPSADGVVIPAAAEAAAGGKSSSKLPKDHPSQHFMPDGRLLSQLSATEAQAVLAAEPRRKVCIEESAFAATASGINKSLASGCRNTFLTFMDFSYMMMLF